MIGNAVPVNLGEFIGLSIQEYLRYGGNKNQQLSLF